MIDSESAIPQIEDSDKTDGEYRQKRRNMLAPLLTIIGKCQTKEEIWHHESHMSEIIDGRKDKANDDKEIAVSGYATSDESNEIAPEQALQEPKGVEVLIDQIVDVAAIRT